MSNASKERDTATAGADLSDSFRRDLANFLPKGGEAVQLLGTG